MTNRVLLVAEDDTIDAMLLERAIAKCGVPILMVHVENGDEAVQYLGGKGRYADRKQFPNPELVLLDLKMPRLDGFGVLRWRLQNQQMRQPVVVFSSSALQQDVAQAYALGASSYVVKPAAPERLEQMVRALNTWWTDFNVVCTSN
ncbi:MAG TPA: response regulator [Opitutaceae bacterium]